MVKRPTKSAIVNMSSQVGDFPFPGISIFSACKAFDNYFTEGMVYEYGHTTNPALKNKIDF